MKKYLIILSLLLPAMNCFAQDDKSAQKNRQTVEKEEQQFQKESRKHPNSATTYFDHANNLAAISSEVKRAGEYYQLALKYDSANAEIYKDYGMYLFDKLRSYNDAKVALEKGLALSPNDEEMKKYLESANKIIALQDEDNRLKDYGSTTIRALNPGGNYAAITKFDSLKILIEGDSSKFNYQTLLTRFLADDKSLTPEEMYMLIVGYSRQKSYTPFNYNDIYEIRMVAGHSIDSAIKKGTELTKNNPLNPTLNRDIMYYYRKKNEPNEADKYLNRIKQFFNGVLYSGNGTCDRPYISLWAKEEYNFISYLGYKPTDIHSMGTCAGQMSEVIDAINPTTGKTEAVHFNVALIYMHTVGK